MKKGFVYIALILIIAFPVISVAQDWKNLSDNLIRDYRGKIISIEQLNASTCWAVLTPHISNKDAVAIAENIGYYVRNTTGGIKGETPSVHVFVNGKHIATARPSGMKYVGKEDVETWNPSVFEGRYRP